MNPEEALTLKPDYWKLYNNIGIIYNKLKEYNIAEKYFNKAIKYYIKALELDPHNYITNYSIASSFYKKENYDNAIKYSKKAISLNSSFVSAYNNLANCDLTPFFLRVKT